ncbi:uncharacterized protein LOC5507265 [Nematostella vectensis]|uniref:uncharacterized protein LOC5507265 n=1 Tax=Nematostella vectensis TaxID=45351 RepID=UPI0020777A2D|nr:uncharacterized protein LOC5507265 [Nematostella vectensis]
MMKSPFYPLSPSIALNCDVQNVAETMRELRDVGSNTCPVRPESVLEFLRKHSGMFAAGMQHDSQECFAVLQEHLFAQLPGESRLKESIITNRRCLKCGFRKWHQSKIFSHFPLLYRSMGKAWASHWIDISLMRF